MWVRGILTRRQAFAFTDDDSTPLRVTFARFLQKLSVHRSWCCIASNASLDNERWGVSAMKFCLNIRLIGLMQGLLAMAGLSFPSQSLWRHAGVDVLSYIGELVLVD